MWRSEATCGTWFSFSTVGRGDQIQVIRLVCVTNTFTCWTISLASVPLTAERVRIAVVGTGYSMVPYIHADLYTAWECRKDQDNSVGSGLFYGFIHTCRFICSLECGSFVILSKNLWNLGIFKVQSKNERYNCEKSVPFINRLHIHFFRWKQI